MGGKIDYADMGKKQDRGSKSGTDLGRKGGSSRTDGIGTNGGGQTTSGTVKDKSFRKVADRSGWGH